jgi:WD40 repeat protein
MGNSEPVQPTYAKRRFRCRPTLRVAAILAALFAVIFVVSWQLTPVEPYATLNAEIGNGDCLFSPDGTMFVTPGERSDHYVFANFHGPLRVWDIAGGQRRFTIAADWEGIGGVQFSPDSSLLAATEWGGNLKLWNTKTGEEVACLEVGSSWLQDFRFSPDGRFLVFRSKREKGFNNESITLWDIKAKQEYGNVECYSDYFPTLAFAPDGHSFATCLRNDDGKGIQVLLWKVEQAPVLAKKHEVAGHLVAFSPDLETFAVLEVLGGGNCRISIWEMATGGSRWSAVLPIWDVPYLFYSANGKVLNAFAVGVNRRTTRWDVTAEPKEIGAFLEREFSVSPDGRWIAVPHPSGVKLISASAPGQSDNLIVHGDQLPMQLSVYPPMHCSASFSFDSKMISVSGLYWPGHEPFLAKWLPPKWNPFPPTPGEAVIRVWDVESCREILTVDNCRRAWFSPDQKVLATLREDSHFIELWKIPFRRSFRHALGWAMIVWLIPVTICWFGVIARRVLFSR